LKIDSLKKISYGNKCLLNVAQSLLVG
jgi:hypothetical protein